MPLCFDTICDGCNNRSMEVSDGLSFYTDHENPLPHPGEMETLKEKYRYSEREAAIKGHLHKCRCYVCNKCGNTNYIYSLYLPNDSFMPPSSVQNTFIVLPIFICIVLFITQFNPFLNIMLFFLLIILPFYLYDKIIRNRILKQHSFSVEMNCQKCNSEQLILIGDYIKNESQKMLCEKCGKREKTCESWALS